MKNFILHFWSLFKVIFLKGSLVFVVLLAFVFQVEAQAPASFSYQAVVRDLSNNPIANTTLGVQITILRGSAAGSNVFRETHNPVTNSAGLVSLEIGMGTILNGDLNALDWNNGPYFIEQAIDPNGGTNYTITSTTQLLSVPYALFARSANRAATAGVADVANSLSASASGGFGVPVGTILPFAGAASSVPSGWLLCDGASYDLNQYPALVGVIGTSYGGGANRFNVPNLQGRTPVGLDGTQTEFSSLGNAGGSKTHTLSVAELPSHNHTGTADSNGAHTHRWQYPFSSSEGGDGRVSILGDDQPLTPVWDIPTTSSGEHSHNLSINNTGSGQPHNNLQPYLTINFIIKAQ